MSKDSGIIRRCRRRHPLILAWSSCDKHDKQLSTDRAATCQGPVTQRITGSHLVQPYSDRAELLETEVGIPPVQLAGGEHSQPRWGVVSV